MKVLQLVHHLLQCDMDSEVMIDIDDFATVNAINVEHIYEVKNRIEEGKKIVILDGDWGKNPTNKEEMIRILK